MEFKNPELTDNQWITDYFRQEKKYGCEWTFANLFLWSSAYETDYVIIEKMLVFRTTSEEISYTFPLGEGDAKAVLDILMKDCKDKNIPFYLYCLTPAMKEKLEEYYPGKFKFTTDDSQYDYIYAQKDLAELAGKKYSAKRNHINKINTLNWSYEDITPENVGECKDMAKEWCRKNDCDQDESKNEEMSVVLGSLDNMEALSMIGGLIRIDERIVAFTVGCEINEDTFDVNIEKAYYDVQGAYPLINREFVSRRLGQYKYINREEDLGIEGLRKAKKSYYPVYWLDSYEATYEG